MRGRASKRAIALAWTWVIIALLLTLFSDPRPEFVLVVFALSGLALIASHICEAIERNGLGR